MTPNTLRMFELGSCQKGFPKIRRCSANASAQYAACAAELPSTLRTSCYACEPCDDVVRSGRGRHRRWVLVEQLHALISADHAIHELQTIATIATSIQCIFRLGWLWGGAMIDSSSV